MNPTGDILLISMSPAIDLLDEDLYVSLKGEDGKWGQVIDLGKTINTRRYEVAPYISGDKKTLYFSSNGHDGYGSADIFVTIRLDDTWQNWSKPLNLGEPINSTGLDAYFVMANEREVYFASDRNSNHINVYKATATGEFVFANADSVGAQFFYKGLPADRIALNIVDEDGNIVDEIITDAYGRFTYVKLDKDQNYLIKLADEDNAEYVGSKIYFVDEAGNKTDRYILTEDGVFVNSNDIKEKIERRGLYSIDGSPSANSALAVLDENSFPIDTITTDSKGNFSYNILKYDGKYSISPVVSSDKNISLHILDKDGNKIQELIYRNNQFVHNTETRSAAEMATIENKEIENKNVEYIKGDNIQVGEWNGISQGNKTIYFDFNQIEPIAKEYKKLAFLISILEHDKNRKVELIGHADNYGPSSVNKRVAENRAKFIGKYLEGKGVAENRIITSSKGEDVPVAPNYTFEGKAKNRRVEIKIK